MFHCCIEGFDRVPRPGDMEIRSDEDPSILAIEQIAQLPN
jgi:hypothetical protein